MATRNSKTSFTAEELRRIISLVRQLEIADSSKQKGIRDKLRKTGLYWSEVAWGVAYTVDNLRCLFENGTLTLISTEERDKMYVAIKSDKHDSSMHSDSHAISACASAKRSSRNDSDEYYIINLCDDILGEVASRQHRFDFLRGDSGMMLPVDAYYPSLNLVVEYHESQHSEPTQFFDKKKTVSGVSRGEQRRIYDLRRQDVLPKHGIKIVIISYTEFGSSKKLVRNPQSDKLIIKRILRENGILL